MLKILPMSDLHLEFSNLTVENPYGADVLVLAGDILVAKAVHDHPNPVDISTESNRKTLGSNQLAAQIFRDFISDVSKKFKHVVVVAGNHEFYAGLFNKSVQYLRDFYGQYPNVHFLEDDAVEIEGVVFVGSTLWTDLNNGDPLTAFHIQENMNDYKKIRHDGRAYRKLYPSDTRIRHERSLAYIEHVLYNSRSKPAVVVTHHSPSRKSTPAKYADQYYMNGAYCSDLDHVLDYHENLKYWIHGHTHHAVQYKVGDANVVCNPRGYESKYGKEETGWNPNLVLEVNQNA